MNHMAAQVIETLELPKDIVYGAVILNITGQNEILVENYKGILEYTCERIILNTKTCLLYIEGRYLRIAYYTSDEMRIIGTIHGIRYQ